VAGQGNTFAGAVAAPHFPTGLSGRIAVPPSKSLTQRALVAAAMAPAGSSIHRPLDAEDPRLLAEALTVAGYRLTWDGEMVVAEGREAREQGAVFLGNNGTGVRFLLAQLAALPGEWVVDGSPRLRERPVGPLAAALQSLGGRLEPLAGEFRGLPPESWHLPIRVHGRELSGGSVALDASASSQFVSALLLLGARLPGGLTIRLVAPPPSRPYLELTAQVLEAFGVSLEMARDRREFQVAGGTLRPARFCVEGDWSAAAFPLAAVAVAGGCVEVAGVGRDSRQGDRLVLDVLETAGCRVSSLPDGVRVCGPVSRVLETDLHDAPDLFPALSVVAAVAGGRLTGLSGLAAKESDRLTVMAQHLAACGFRLERTGDAFLAPGGLTGTAAPRGALNPAADHRIAMSLAVLGSVLPGLRVADPACVEKSWPDFWDAWNQLAESQP